jgi:carbamoyl-phosphate synthase large subunit
MVNQPSVLVTGVGGGAVGHQILHALLLMRDRYRIVATDADAFAFGLYQVENRYTVPLARDPGYIPALLRIIDREKIEALLPGTPQEVGVVARHQAELAAAGCTAVTCDPDIACLCGDKWQLQQWLEANGFDTPRTVSAAHWRTLAEQVGFPLVGKPADHCGGSRHVAILKNAEEVLWYLKDTADSGEVMFQEYIDDSEGEFTVGVMISKDARVIDSIVLQRKLTGISLGHRCQIDKRCCTLSTGYSQGFIVKHPMIQHTCEALAERLGVRGPLNIQCRLVGEAVKIFEVHPRFSGTTSIRAEVGFNEPDILLRSFLRGEQFGRLPYRAGVAAIRAFQHTIVPQEVIAQVGTA